MMSRISTSERVDLYCISFCNGEEDSIYSFRFNSYLKKKKKISAFIHVVGDFVQSLGVFIAALIIFFKVS